MTSYLCDQISCRVHDVLPDQFFCVGQYTCYHCDLLVLPTCRSFALQNSCTNLPHAFAPFCCLCDIIAITPGNSTSACFADFGHKTPDEFLSHKCFAYQCGCNDVRLIERTEIMDSRRCPRHGLRSCSSVACCAGHTICEKGPGYLTTTRMRSKSASHNVSTRLDR